MGKPNKNNDAYGLDSVDTENVRTVTPTYNLGQLKIGETVHMRILDAQPRMVSFVDKKTKEEKEIPVLNHLNKTDGTQCTIWLSSKSLKLEYYKLSVAHNNDLTNVDITITPRTYTHEKYGKVKGYTVLEDKS